MAQVQIHRDDVELDAPMLVEGLPGVGLVGKIAVDHLVSKFDMTHYGSLHCDGLPEVAVYHENEDGVDAPVRLYADAERNLLALTSDVPVSPTTASEFATCVTSWLESNDVTPIYLSGLPTAKDGVPALTGVAAGSVGERLTDANIDRPNQNGAVTGPTGALLYEASRRDLDAFGLIVEADKQFPDPEAARVILVDGVGPLTGVDVQTASLVEQAEEIADAKAKFAEQMQPETDESTSARPLGMYQ